MNLKCSFQDTEKIYMVFDYMPGGNLQTHLNEAGKFSEEQTSKLEVN